MPEPPSLAGPRARLDRAEALIDELNEATRTFTATRPYRAVEVDDTNPLNRRFIFEAVAEVPLQIRVRAGEIVHHTRAALDLLVYQLLLCAGVNDEKRFRQCAFPIVAMHDPNDREQVTRYTSRMKKAIDGVKDDARDRIEAVQPWRPGNPGVWSHLSQVEELDNTQKHRLLLTGVVAFRMRNFVLNEKGVTKLIPEAFFPIGPGQMIIANGIAPGTPFDRNFADDVIFHESGPPSGWPLGHILRNLNAMTRETVEGFADCL